MANFEAPEKFKPLNLIKIEDDLNAELIRLAQKYDLKNALIESPVEELSNNSNQSKYKMEEGVPGSSADDQLKVDQLGEYSNPISYFDDEL